MVTSLGVGAAPRRVIVAPDKFKGSISGPDAASAIRRGLDAAVPGLEVVELPLADGGEGTVALLLTGRHTPVPVSVSGPLHASTVATMAVNEDTAVIESASAAGLGLLGPVVPNESTATSSSTGGVGELIKAALDRGARRIVVGIGGTASTDGGAGALTALGARILDADGYPVPPGGSGLEVAAKLDCTGLDPRLAHVELVVACDVDSPLIGPDGAAHVFGPQKGATPDVVGRLDAALTTWADVTAVATSRDLRHLPGMGAGGGLAFGLAAVLGARLESGATMLMQVTGLEAALEDAELVVVGEGSLDPQSLQGKAPVAVARLAASRGIPVVALVGRSLLDCAQISAAGLVAVHAIADIEPDPARQLSSAAELLEQGGRLLGERYL